MAPAKRTLALAGVVVGLGAAALLRATSGEEAPAPAAPSASSTGPEPLTPPPAPDLAARFPPPAFARVKRRLLRHEGAAHRFVERHYDPPYVLPSLAAPLPTSALTSPERLMASLASALVAKDAAWLASLWVEGEAPARDDEALARARALYGGKTLVLTRQLVIGQHTIVYFRPSDLTDDHPAALVPTVITQTPDGRWQLTQALHAHPLLGWELLTPELTFEDLEDGT